MKQSNYFNFLLWLAGGTFPFVADKFQLDTTSLPRDDAGFRNLPAVAFVIPDDFHDMHSAPKHKADEWLKENIGPYVEWAKAHNSLFILTWDEAEPEMNNNQIATLFVGPMVKPGSYNELVYHYSVLRTIEDFYGLAHLGKSSNAQPISDIWTFNSLRSIENMMRNISGH